MGEYESRSKDFRRWKQMVHKIPGPENNQLLFENHTLWYLDLLSKSYDPVISILYASLCVNILYVLASLTLFSYINWYFDDTHSLN